MLCMCMCMCMYMCTRCWRGCICAVYVYVHVHVHVYQVLAGLHGGTRGKALVLALLCAAVQLIAPLLLLLQSSSNALQTHAQEHEGEAHEGWEARSLPLLRILFALYGAAYEYRMLRNNRIDAKLTCFLAALPGYSAPALVFGTLMNLLARVLVAVCMVAVIGESESASDIILNALALFFIWQLDNDLALEIEKFEKDVRRNDERSGKTCDPGKRRAQPESQGAP